LFIQLIYRSLSNLSPLVHYFDGRQHPASVSSRAMENGDDVSYVYYDITFDDTAHLEKQKRSFNGALER
jgi:hypothetical protein